jgi:uncharacterized protein YegP (UPF0339 family)
MYYVIWQNASKQWYWHLQAANSKIIATSGEGYWNKADCLAAINLVKSSSNAPVLER